MGHRQRVRGDIEAAALFVDEYLFFVQNLFGSNWENMGSLFVTNLAS
jgi:hypothetical protein